MSNTDTMVNVADEARPMTFSDMVGQVFIEGVGKRLGSGKISGQGYILAGPKGCGKTSAARIIARSVNCTNRDPDTGDPCNECSSCLLSLKGAHPAIEEINAAEKRGINDIKQVLSSMNLAINTGFRVYILDEIHMLTKEAFSTLLKPMEQPPHNVLFIATTTNPEVIPDTIVSRVPIIPVNPLTDEDVEKVLHRLVEKNAENESLWNEVSQDDIDYAVRRSQGSARQAITTLSGIIFHGVSQGAKELNFADEIAQLFVQGDITQVLSLSQQACKEDSIHPVSLVQSIMDEIFSLMDGKDKSQTASLSRAIAELSMVCSSLSASTPALMTASKIASCVPVMDSQPSSNVNSQEEDKSHLESILEVKKDTSVEDVVEHLVQSRYGRKILSSRWRGIIDDPDRSDISIKGKTVFISVERPTKQLKGSLEKLLSSVSLSRL